MSKKTLSILSEAYINNPTLLLRCYMDSFLINKGYLFNYLQKSDNHIIISIVNLKKEIAGVNISEQKLYEEFLEFVEPNISLDDFILNDNGLYYVPYLITLTIQIDNEF